MGMFSWLFKKKDVLQIADPVFGFVRFDGWGWNKDSDGSKPDFGIWIDAPASGPTDTQKVFYQRLQARLPFIKEKAIEFVRSVEYHAPDIDDLSIYSIEIQDDEKTKKEHFLVELTDATQVVIHRVSFEGNEPVDYSHDD